MTEKIFLIQIVFNNRLEMIKTNFLIYNSYFEMQFKLFRLVGIRFDLSEPKKDTLTEELGNMFYRVFCYSLYAMQILFCICYLILTDTSLDKKLAVFSNTVAHATAFTKFFTIATNLEKIEKIIKTLGKLYSQQQLDKMIEPQKFIRKATFICKSAKFFMCMSPFLLFLPCVATYLDYWTQGQFNPQFPTDLWCPIDLIDHYLFIYFLVFYARVIMSLNMGAGDSLFYMILAHITQQLKELTRDFNELRRHGNNLTKLINRQIELLESVFNYFQIRL